jgi:hypothetical protein
MWVIESLAGRIPTCRSFATISSGLCLFLDIDPSSSWLRAIPQGGPPLRGQTNQPDRMPIPIPIQVAWECMNSQTVIDSAWVVLNSDQNRTDPPLR